MFGKDFYDKIQIWTETEAEIKLSMIRNLLNDGEKLSMMKELIQKGEQFNKQEGKL